MIIQSRRSALSAAVAIAAALAGTIVALHYHRLGLTLSHYDARGHLVVARRIIDSITPGWQQIGAVWLPLPHLLAMLPVQIDAFYRSGAFAVAISIAAFAVAAGGTASIVMSVTGSAVASLVAAAVFVLNPNVLYLQATPMTEPLLLALTIVAVAMLIDWCAPPAVVPAALVPPAGGAELARPPKVSPPAGRSTSAPASALVGWTFALACLTRYEAWPVTACALFAAVWVRWRLGESLISSSRGVARIAIYPAAAALAFLIFSRIVIGQWFVSSGFFVPENKALGDPLLAAAEIGWGIRTLSGPLIVTIAAAGLLALVAIGVAQRERAAGIIVLALMAAAALPWLAFVKGHPFRIRYMVPLIVIEAIGAGVLVGASRRLRLVLAFIVAGIVAYELRPLDTNAPMVAEAQWDRPNGPVRRMVTDCLRAAYDGDGIMASMGSLAHYMQETSHDGFRIADFLHEGNGDIWLAALDGPRPFVGWVLIEEKANGGDMLAKLARERPHLLDGFTRVCEGAGLALYKRAARAY